MIDFTFPPTGAVLPLSNELVNYLEVGQSNAPTFPGKPPPGN